MINKKLESIRKKLDNLDNHFLLLIKKRTSLVNQVLLTKKFKNQMLKNIPLGRVAKESDVATAVAFLAADSSEMITGTSLVVDGGWTAK